MARANYSILENFKVGYEKTICLHIYCALASPLSLDSWPSAPIQKAAKTVAHCCSLWAFFGQWAKLINVTRGVCLTFVKHFPKNALLFIWSQLANQTNFLFLFIFLYRAWLVQLFCQLDSVCHKNLENTTKKEEKKLEKLNSTFFLDQMPVNKSFASCN